MANGKWDCCEVSKARPNQMHDELLRDDPKLNLGRKHASGGMLFHFRLIGATARQRDSGDNQLSWPNPANLVSR